MESMATEEGMKYLLYLSLRKKQLDLKLTDLTLDADELQLVVQLIDQLSQAGAAEDEGDGDAPRPTASPPTPASPDTSS